jgi:RimJ/RimL family protein N-acetyltransferase
VLETKDLIIKKAELSDWPDIYRNLWQHEESAKHMLWGVTKTEEDAKIRIQKTIAHQEKTPFSYFVYEKKDGQAIGFAGMMEIAPNVYEDTGIAIGPAFVRKGYGRQILMALVNLAFEELGATKFVASCRSQNDASRQLQLACGFVYSHSEDRTDPRNGMPYVLEFYELENNKK